MGRKAFDWKLAMPEVERLAGLGLTEREICKCIGCSQETLAKYKRLYPEFLECIKKGKARTHEKVANVLYDAAVNMKNISAAMFLLKTRFGYRENGKVSNEDTEPTAPGVIIYQEIDGRRKT